MATRTYYASGNRRLDITLSGTHEGTWWTVEGVYDKSLHAEMPVLGMNSIMASTEHAAFARICDCIDTALRSKT
jgi:hypothetical protein